MSRRLHDIGLFGRVCVKKPLLSKKNQKARLTFAQKYKHWTPKQWSKVLFSDESKFNLFVSDGRKYVQRQKNTGYDSLYHIPRLKHEGGSVMVSGAMSSREVGPWHEVKGIMDLLFIIWLFFFCSIKTLITEYLQFYLDYVALA